MFDFIKKMFGEGKIRADVVFEDGSIGTVKVPYIGDIGTLSYCEFETDMKRKIYVEHGRKVRSVTIVGVY
jgi:hypothetical protein